MLMQERYPNYFPMGKTIKTLRKSIFTFLQNYHYFTSTPTLLALPFAASSLLSHTLLVPSSHLFPLVHGRLTSLSLAAGFPPSSELFAILNLKLAQTILSFIFALPFSLSFLLLSKASVINALEYPKPTKKRARSHWISLFNPLLTTQLCNSIVILSANATCFGLLLVFFNCYEFFGISSPGSLLLVSATGAIIYSIILANAYIICNLALILTGVEKCGGFWSILKTMILARGRNATALSLSVTTNLSLVAVEWLFQYRIVRGYDHRAMDTTNAPMVLEGMFIAYLYGALLVLDTIVGYTFLKSCEVDYGIMEEEDFSYRYSINVQESDVNANMKGLEFLP